MIVSYAGYGRNATLIAFNEIKNRIESKVIPDHQSIDDALVEVITAGRQVRGTEVMRQGIPVPVGKFVHSETQLAALREALNTHLANKVAIKAAETGAGVSADTPAGRAFDLHRFHLRHNTLVGDCLYCSLEGTEAEPDLKKDYVVELRKQVAEVLAGGEETDAGKSRNLAEFNTACRQAGKPYDRTRVGMTNLEFAEFQKKPGNFSGDMEIQQWLSLKGNQHRTVVLIDAQVGQESIKIYRHNQNVTLFNGDDLGETEEDISAAIDYAIYGVPLASRPAVPTIPDQRIVLYRTVGHFQRLTGVKTELERWQAVLDQKAEYEKMKKQPEFVDITELGFETRS